MRHRKLLIFIIFLGVVAAVGGVAYYRVFRPSHTLYFLPDGDLVLYVNFSPAHFFDVGQIPAAESDPEYQDFVQRTGFHFEHDLDTIAISQRNPGGSESESSAIFTGHFDKGRLSDYLQRRSSSTENYADTQISVLQQGDHVVRACLLDDRTVAVTNMRSAEPMHSIIDKARHSTGKGPSLVENYYGDVPFGSLAWAIIRVPQQSGSAPVAGDFNMEVLQNTVSVLSVRYTGSIRLRAEVISASEADAAKVLEAANLFLVFTKGIASSVAANGPDKDVNAAFGSIQVQKNGTHTVLSATIPQAAVQKIADRMKH